MDINIDNISKENKKELKIQEEFGKKIVEYCSQFKGDKYTIAMKSIEFGYQLAKWQTERMYSEEDMLNFAWFLHENIGQYSCDRTAHFEGDYLKQFKKK